MDINITVNAPDLSSAIQSLADAIVATGCLPGNTGLFGIDIPNETLVPQIETPVTTDVYPQTTLTVQPVHQIVPDQQLVQQAYPQQPVQQFTPPAAVPTQAPLQQIQSPPVQVMPQPDATAPIIPTTTQTYTMEQLAVAATQLVDANRRQDLLNLLGQFGVQALTALPKEQYGAFATQLRALGAKI